MTEMRSGQDDISLTFAWNEAIEELYTSWQRKVAAAERIHELAGERLRARHAIVGALLVMACMVAAAGAFAPLGIDPGTITEVGLDRDELLLATGAAASIAAVLATALVILRYPARAESHRVAALRYGSLAREIEGTLAIPRAARREPDRALVDARERMDRYAKSSPAIARRVRRHLERASTGSVSSSAADPTAGFFLPDGTSVARV